MKTSLRILFVVLLMTTTVITFKLIKPAPDTLDAAAPPAISSVTAELNPDTTQKQPPTPPDIVLYGTFINDEIRIALISTDNAAQRWLHAEQSLNNNFYLDGIFADHIIVRDTDRTLTLKIKISNKVSDSLPGRTPALPAHAGVALLPPVPGIDRINSHHYRIDRELLNKELNSGEIFRQIRIVPDEDGGFFIKSIKSGSLPEIIGLHVGDIIHKVNNKPLTSITDVLDLYKQLDTMKKVDVEINRTHKLQQLHYDLE
jgi:type II secretory pathway component PulC